MITFVRTVPTAPSTTTVQVSGATALGFVCPPAVEPIHKKPYQGPPPPPPAPPKPCPPPIIALPASPRGEKHTAREQQLYQQLVVAFNKAWNAGNCTACRLPPPKMVKKVAVVKPPIATFYRPYGDDVNLRGGFGVILSPPEINRSLSNGARHVGPTSFIDQFRRSDFDMYYDTPLGAVPTDDELALHRECYTPVHSGWIDARPATLAGLAETMDTLTKQQKLALLLSIVSTFAIVTSAAVSVYRNIKMGQMFQPMPTPASVK